MTLYVRNVHGLQRRFLFVSPADPLSESPYIAFDHPRRGHNPQKMPSGVRSASRQLNILEIVSATKQQNTLEIVSETKHPKIPEIVPVSRQQNSSHRFFPSEMII